MICNNIIKTKQQNSISIKNTYIDGFGVSFRVNYEFLEKDKLLIGYEIKLAKDGDKLFGIINCEYCFDVNVADSDLINGEIKEECIRKCLKANHQNIFELIEDTLSEYGIRYEDPYKKYRS